MIQDDYRAAIDIGTTKVCAILARKRPDHRVELLGIGIAPCNGMSRGTVSDPQAVAEAVRSAVSALSEDAGMNIARAYIGLTGSHLQSQNRWNNVPRDPGMRAVSDQDLALALRSAGKVELGPDRRLLHVIPRTYALDGIHGVRNPIGMHTSELHIQSHVITGSVNHIRSLQDAVKAAGVTPLEIVVEPVASADAVLTADEREDGAILVDVGGGTSDIAVFYEGAIVHTAVLPVGGFQFTNDLSIAFSLDFEDAEQLKIEYGTAAPELVGMTDEITIHPTNMDEPLTVTRREVGQVLKERVHELFQMIRLKLDEPHLAEVPIEHIVFTGGGAKLEGFLNLAKFVFQTKVRLASPRGLDGLPEPNRDPAYSAAVGITLWGMRNLPRENHVSRPRQTAAVEERGGGVFSALKGWIPGRNKSGETATRV